MTFITLDELRDTLLRLRLVTAEQIDECVTKLSPRCNQPSEFLRVLERMHYLTPYQRSRLDRDETDALVLGNHKLLYRNASGSYARVFRACCVDDGRMVGLKVLRERWAKDPAAVAQFRREAELGMQLQHKNIVPIYDVCSQENYHYFTMEFVEGGNLRDFIKIRKKLSPSEATHCVLDMCEALEYSFGRGVTHRDLKLTNVLMSMRRESKLVDFGLAGDAEQIVGHSDYDGVQRALEYATLEKATDAPRNDPRSDLFFVGAIFYELLTGVPPYPRTRSREARKQITRYLNVKPVRAHEPNIPRSVADIVERLMKVTPSQRYQTASSVVSDLYATLSEIGDSPQDTGEIPKPPPRNGEPGPERTLPTVMCIENRTKQQNLLREYLSKHGFRVLVLNDLQRGLSRLETNPPDCVVLMGESIGKGVGKAFQQAVEKGSRDSVVTVAILSEKQARWQRKLTQTRTARVMVQPITLRDLRREIHLAFQRVKRDSRGPGS